MKIRDSFRFPYPVLNERYSDYIDDTIDLDVVVGESMAGKPTELSFTISLKSETILKSIADGTSRAFLSVVCQDTFFNKFYPLDELKGKISIAQGELFALVSVRAVIARVRAGTLDAIGASSEYISTKFEVRPGSVLAWTSPREFDAGLEKLAPMASIFQIAEDRDVSEGAFSVDPDDEHITIRVSPQLHKLFSLLRNTSEGRAVMLNSVYLPVLIEVILHFRTEAFKSRRWSQVIEAKADLAGVVLTSGSPLERAQALLMNPALRLSTVAERL